MKWEKSEDSMNGSPRYSPAGIDPSNSIKRITLVIVRERELEYQGAEKKRYVYYGHISDEKTETGDVLGPFTRVRDAKAEMEKAFKHCMELIRSRHVTLSYSS